MSTSTANLVQAKLPWSQNKPDGFALQPKTSAALNKKRPSVQQVTGDVGVVGSKRLRKDHDSGLGAALYLASKASNY